MKARKGFRAAVVEVKPGLFVVAEVPERSVEIRSRAAAAGARAGQDAGTGVPAGPGGAGPAGCPAAAGPFPARPQPAALPAPQPRAALPGPVEDDDRLARWLDDDIAAELGCRACERRG